MKRVVVFDAYGTLFDVEGLVQRAEGLGLARAADLVRLWRSKQLEYTWLRTLLGRYEDFWAVTGASLEYACEALGVALTPEAREALLRGFLEPPAFPDAVPALAHLASRGVRCCVFSNGTRAMVGAAARTSGLGAYLDGIASVDDEAKVYKPHPAAYASACRTLGIEAQQALFVSANGFDVAGAGNFGFATAWVNRKGAAPDRLGVAAGLVVRDLLELAAALV